MKTSTIKQLLIGCALAAALVSQARAQDLVYFRAEIPPGLQLLADPVKPLDPSLDGVFEGMPEGTRIYTFTGSGFSETVKRSAGWEGELKTFGHAQVGFLEHPLDTNVLQVWWGEAPVGEFTTEIPPGISPLGCKILKGGKLTTDLGLSLNVFDNLFLWRGANYVVYTCLPDGKWSPQEPQIKIGEGFFVNVQQRTNWTVSFKPPTGP